MPGAPRSEGPLRGGAEPGTAGPAVLAARHKAKLSPGSRGAASTGRRAGGPAAARSGGSSAPPASSPPASLRPPARAGGAPSARLGGGGALLVRVFSACAATAMSVRAPKSLTASPARVPLLALPPAHAAGPGESGGWRPRPCARSRQSAEPAEEEFFALPSSFTLLVFSPKGEKKAAQSPYVRARCDRGWQEKKRGGGGNLALAVREETFRASPLRFPGLRGGCRGRGRRNLFRLMLPAPRPPQLPSALFLLL